MRKLGTLEPVIYFVNQVHPSRPKGYIVLAPYSDFPTPPGHTREAAETLAEVDKLQRLLIKQEMNAAYDEWVYNETLTAAQHERVRADLLSKMISSGTSEFEKEFIRAYLQLREEKREKYRQRFLERTMYLWARENDTPGRAADSETVNVDRIG